MLDTVIKADGIGLAAPQVGKSLNLALIYLEHSGVPMFPIINPKIVSVSKELVPIEEGCLSLPGLFGEVQRPKKITIEYQDVSGAVKHLEDAGWIARVCQHEVDHLLGTLIVDKLERITQGKELLAIYEPDQT
jgi:peptide deformylase